MDAFGIGITEAGPQSIIDGGPSRLSLKSAPLSQNHSLQTRLGRTAALGQGGVWARGDCEGPQIGSCLAPIHSAAHIGALSFTVAVGSVRAPSKRGVVLGQVSKKVGLRPASLSGTAGLVEASG